MKIQDPFLKEFVNTHPCKNLSIQTLSQDEIFLHETDPLLSIYFILQGRCKIIRSSRQGKTFLLEYAQRGDTIGDLEWFLNKKTATATVIALEKTKLLSLPVENNREIILHSPLLLQKLGEQVAQKLVQMSDKGYSFALHSARENLAIYLLKNGKDNHYSGTLSDAATAIGISYRHLQRLIKEFCQKSILKKEGRSYQIINSNLLLQEAEGKK